MSDSDFVRWEDVDLGQYTADDERRYVNVDTCDSSDSDRENRPPPPKEAKQSASSVCRPTYVCPICQKELKTIGGFRGHVSKQHNKPHLKGKHAMMTYCKPNDISNTAYIDSTQYKMI